METVTILLKTFTELPMDYVNALIALCALGVAAFAIYAVLTLVKGGKAR